MPVPSRGASQINPNGKVPAILDTDGPGGKAARVFDSTAILLYLAEKAGKLGDFDMKTQGKLNGIPSCTSKASVS